MSANICSCGWRSVTSLLFLPSVFAFVNTGLVACRNKPVPPAPPPATVTVSVPLRERIVDWDEYQGRLESPETVTVTSRVSGVIEQARFLEGSLVSKGDVLYVIDSRWLLAELKSKEADLLKAQAQLGQAEAHFRRIEKLKGTRAIAAEDFDEAAAVLAQARASVAVAGAAHDTSKLSVEWTTVTAPISGRIGKRFVTEGNQISGGTGQSTPLTSITSVDPLYCYVNIPEDAYFDYQRSRKERNPAGRTPAFVRLSDEDTFGHEGYIDFIDNRVHPGTGTVEVRAIIPNRDGALTPGSFARMRIPSGPPGEALLVPDSAVGNNQDSRFVTIVRDDNSIEQRPVKLGPLLGTLRVVRDGLAGSERVIISGLQQARPGAKVNPQPGNISADSLKPYVAPEARA